MTRFPFTHRPVTVDTTDTRPLPVVDLGPPSHRARHARRISPWRVIVPAGGLVVAAVAMVFAGYGIFTVFTTDHPRGAEVAPRTEEPPSEEPVEVTPSRPGRTGADRSRKRSPEPVLVVPAPRRTRTWSPSPSPSPKPSSSRPSPTPQKPSASPSPTGPTTSPTPAGSSSPTATPTDGGIRVP